MRAKHLTLEERKIIQEGIEKRLSKTAIARSLHKDPTTIAKEIKKHRTLKPRNRFNSPVICSNFKQCSKPRKYCSEACPSYTEQSCSLRDRSVGACNHCPDIKHCRLDHYFYNASHSHEAYLFHLSDSRQGVNLSEPERVLIAQTIAPLLKKGQSLYQILPNQRNLEHLTQADMNLMFDHINSVPRKVLGGRAPYEVFFFFYGETLLHKLGVRRIEPDSVTLQPYLLKIE